MPILSSTVVPFGIDRLSGEEVNVVTLKNEHGMTAQFLTYGATLISLTAKNTTGQYEEVTLCHRDLPTLQQTTGRPFYGTIAGRFANRIAKGQFTLDDVQYQLATNNNNVNHLHGGLLGFNTKVWKFELLPVQDDRVGVRFTYLSVDGEEQYPGDLLTRVSYYLTNQDDLVIDIEAETNKATILNLTNHTYWNLSGDCRENIFTHHLALHCSHYLPVDNTQIPTGELRPITQDSEFNLSHDHSINAICKGRNLGEVIPLVDGNGRAGLDHCYVRAESSNVPKYEEVPYLGCLTHPASGRAMTIYTTQPGVQVYTANWLNNEEMEKNHPHIMHNAICLETQHYPNSINTPHFPSVVLRPDDKFFEKTIYSFRVL